MKQTLCIAIFLVLLASAFAFSQYTGSDIERKNGENLHPEPGPGELLIVDQLKETNRLLTEQAKLLVEQNRILLQSLEEAKKVSASERKANQ